MKKILLILVFLEISEIHSETLSELMSRCAPAVHPQTLQALILTESSANPYAISVVRGAKQPAQPKTYEEALGVVNYLNHIGANYSIGIAQINSANFSRYGVSAEQLLDPCVNLQISQKILQDCHSRSGDIDKTLSCYYSGNFRRGFVTDYKNSSYVGRIYAKKQAQKQEITIPALKASPPPTIAKARIRKTNSKPSINSHSVNNKQYSMLDFELSD
ncbi:MAG: lytic transglycosylase domain-containing protein [Neisseriaceae bacterium]|nr:lytic transglycosylase domain-containing protein [Neisseriaceae bacterium]